MTFSHEQCWLHWHDWITCQINSDELIRQSSTSQVSVHKFFFLFYLPASIQKSWNHKKSEVGILATLPTCLRCFFFKQMWTMWILSLLLVLKLFKKSKFTGYNENLLQRYKEIPVLLLRSPASTWRTPSSCFLTISVQENLLNKYSNLSIVKTKAAHTCWITTAFQYNRDVSQRLGVLASSPWSSSGDCR